jgi:hypothetical protein
MDESRHPFRHPYVPSGANKACASCGWIPKRTPPSPAHQALTTLISALPRCNNGECQNPATHRAQLGTMLLVLACDECMSTSRVSFPILSEVGYAAELRAAIAAVKT